MKIPFKPLQFPYHVFRKWLAHPIFWALFLLGPTLNMVRVDVFSQEVIYFGKAYPFNVDNLMWLPIGFYACVLIIAVSTAFLGRLFCGWICPHNIMTEWTRPLRAVHGIEPKPAGMIRLERQHPLFKKYFKFIAPIIAVIVTVSISFLLFHYVLPYHYLMGSYLSGSPHPTLVMGQGIFTVLGLYFLYSGHLFCKSCCPYGLAQSISAYQTGKWRPMEIIFKPRTEHPDYTERADSCHTCTGCQQVCPVDLDPRDAILSVGAFEGCFNCGECIDACKHIQSYQGNEPLLGFKSPFNKSFGKKAI